MTQHKTQFSLLEPIRQQLRDVTLPGLILLNLVLVSCASPVDDVVLNSDRIRQEFGSYGVDILFSSSRRRISSLYSTTRSERITRTFAIVEFSSPPHAALATEHGQIVSGQSIGETFRAAGWQIEKHNVFIGELTVPATHTRIASLLQIVLPRTLVAHVYVFVVAKDDMTLTYATIYEIHHPEYLTVDDLHAIYGEVIFDDSDRNNLDDFVSLPDEFQRPN